MKGYGFPAGEYEALGALLRRIRRVVITTHRRPDGDAMGSSLGLGLVLRQMGMEVHVVPPSPHDGYLSWMPGMEMVVTATEHPEEALRLLGEAEAIFCLDFGGLGRIEQLAEPVAQNPCPKIMIDHHIGPEAFALLNFHRVGASSTAELVYVVVNGLGMGHLITKEVAECLYVGLMTDTGSFRFSSTTPDVHRIAAHFLEIGIDVGRIHNLIFDNFSESRTRFLGYMLHEKMRVMREYRTSYMTISLEERRRFSIQEGETEGFVNYNLTLGGINFGVLLIEAEDKTKFSFRSIGAFPCNQFAGYFNGGGHHNASGGQLPCRLEEAEARFLEVLSQFSDQLQYER